MVYFLIVSTILISTASCCFRRYGGDELENNYYGEPFNYDYFALPQGPLARPVNPGSIPRDIALPYSQDHLKIRNLPNGHIAWADPIFKLPEVTVNIDDIGNEQLVDEYSPLAPPLANVRLPSGALVPLNKKAAQQLIKAAKLLQSAAGNQEASLDSANDIEAISSTRIVLNTLLGPFAFDDISVLSKEDDRAVNAAEDLDCDFSGDCCWHNMGGGSDDLEWMLINSELNEDHAASSLRAKYLPTAPFAATGSLRTHSLVYGFMVSCPFLCTTGDGQLTFEHWTSEAVTLDVCILPLEQRNFTDCETIRATTYTSSKITIKQQDKPFLIVIVASEFTSLNGGVAAIDNIKFRGPVCTQHSLELEEDREDVAQQITEPPVLNDSILDRDIPFQFEHNILDPQTIQQAVNFHNQLPQVVHSAPFYDDNSGNSQLEHAGYVLNAIRDRIPPEYFEFLQPAEVSKYIVESEERKLDIALPPAVPIPDQTYEDPFVKAKQSKPGLIPSVRRKVDHTKPTDSFYSNSSPQSVETEDYAFAINPSDVLYGQGSDYDDVCRALECHLQNGSYCQWQNAGDVDFIAVGNQFANWAAGVLKPKDGSNFLAAPIDLPEQVAILESAVISPSVDFTISFKFFEAAHDVSFRVCYDSIFSSDSCQVFGRRTVTAADRAWREGRFTVPNGHHRRIYMVAEGHGSNRGAVGLYDIRVVEARTSSGTVRVDCTNTAR